MITKTHRSLLASVACLFLLSSAGCSSLPWRAQRVASSSNSAENYAQQAVDNIDYSNPEGYLNGYQSGPPSASNYSAPAYPVASNTASESCTSGCCK